MHRQFLTFVIVAVTMFCPDASAQTVADNAEARAFFERGNALFGRARSTTGSQRTTLLGEALTQYANSLQIVRSRNALYNAAVVSVELGRYADGYNYFGEYAAIDDLSDASVADARARMKQLAKSVAVVRVGSEPRGATVHVDRPDLAPVGHTPIEVAIVPGEHRLIVALDGFETATTTLNLAAGEHKELSHTLMAIAVPVTIETAAETMVRIDGLTVLPGRATPLQPGEHVVTLERGTQTARHRVVIEPGSPPQTIRLSMPDATVAKRASLRNGAIAAGAASLAIAGVATGLAFRARNLRTDYNAAVGIWQTTGNAADLARARSLADDTDRANLTTDALFGVAAAAGVTGLVLYLVHRKQKRADKPSVGIAPSRDGVFVHARWSLGGVH